MVVPVPLPWSCIRAYYTFRGMLLFHPPPLPPPCQTGVLLRPASAFFFYRTSQIYHSLCTKTRRGDATTCPKWRSDGLFVIFKKISESAVVPLLPTCFIIIYLRIIYYEWAIRPYDLDCTPPPSVCYTAGFFFGHRARVRDPDE